MGQSIKNFSGCPASVDREARGGNGYEGVETACRNPDNSLRSAPIRPSLCQIERPVGEGRDQLQPPPARAGGDDRKRAFGIAIDVGQSGLSIGP